MNNPSSVTTQTSSDLNLEMMEIRQQQIQKLRELHSNDPDLVLMIVYFEEEPLPKDEKATKMLPFESKYYEMIDGVLHLEHPTDPGKWCIYSCAQRRTVKASKRLCHGS